MKYIETFRSFWNCNCIVNSRQIIYNQVYNLKSCRKTAMIILLRTADKEGHGMRSHQLLVESAKINYWLVSKQLFFYYD